ncbi:ABC-type amino acid transport/signal transduction systems, periplasmic component/domain [Methanoculleus bourgensis MS2]|jgi:polar amino acid transport system substrate-binding protein|uniref:ABC-type amino acid transport/signal transduction systems, periplasmic component/domain n=1 Tax=Methanoculleus bourgensis (strain ATCC 43281 / DSM 3045 / OCM 15 / MS2) TaxID=1201294 RepID=I7LNK1_METBM|nr:ABC transporter substrate-binding protein [Methanoculleus bourgensis]CCJ37164.1 ABC-type amino acid transport/signal transduction systems, periplasmic component/domain [Methanoculleus bourgensis MS2]
MKMHGIFTLLACIVAVLAVAGAGCTGTADQTDGAGLKDSYIVGIDAAYPPYSYIDKDGNAQGFDVDSMKWIAEKKGIKVTFMDVDWDSIIPALQAEKIDMVYAGMTITPLRLEAVNFTDPYWTVNQDVVAAEGSDVTIDDVLAGKVIIGTQRGCTAALWIEENLIETGKMPEQNLKLYSETPLAVNDLTSGRIDAVMYDDVSLKDIVRGTSVKVIGSVDTQEDFGVAIRKGDTALLEFMNEAIAELQADPYWEELKEKHNLK